MRRLIWRPRAVSRRALVLIAIFAAGGYYVAERVVVRVKQPHYDQKLRAAELAQRAMLAIKEARVDRGFPIQPTVDPAETGLIGLNVSDVTSVAGNLASKQTSINPNFAAVVLEMLKELGVQEGDFVAVGVSGSFPALNICVYSALETLKAQPIIVASAAASQWGANFDDFLWIDMEKTLFDLGFFSFRAVASSIGGVEDRGLGMSSIGRQKIREAIRRNGLEYVRDVTFQESVETRMALYGEKAKGAPIRTYINIGGGAASVGRSVGKKLFRPGINRRSPPGAGLVDGVMPRFVAQKVPVIHLVQILDLAERYSFELEPARMPGVGLGDIFDANEYSSPLVASILCGLIGSLFVFIRSDVGFRLFKGGAKPKDTGHPEPMV